MSKGNLERFELDLDESIFLKGEELFDQGSVVELTKGENNLYTAKVSDGDKIYEIEILNPASLQRKSTCDCSQFHKTGNCPHIVATLFSIRKKLSRPSKKKKQSSRKIQEERLNIKSLVEVLSDSEMKAFIQDYARRDKKFDLFLKARYAKKIDLKDNSLKYKAILDSLIPPAKSANYKISKSSITQAIRFFDEFIVQIEDSMALHQYREAFDILGPVLRKLSYVRHYAKIASEPLDQLYIQYHKLIHRILISNAAPELLDVIKEYMISLAAFSYYDLADFNYNLLKILHDHDQKYLDDVIEISNDYLSYHTNPLSLALYLYFITPKMEISHLKPYYDNQQLLIKSLEILIENKYPITVKKAINLTHDLGWNNSGFDEVYLNLLKLDENYHEFVSFSMTKLLESQQFYFYKLMINKLDPEFHIMVHNGIESIKQELDSDLLCRIYEYNSNWEALMSLLSEKNDIYLTMKYDAPLFESHYDSLKSFYLTSIESYLNNHLGFEADRYINHILDHLRMRNVKPLIKSIRSMIQDKYPHRKRFLSLHT